MSDTMNDREAADFIYRVRPYLVALMREFGGTPGGGSGSSGGSIYVPLTRIVYAGAGLSGGGNLSTDITLTVNVDNTGAAGLTVEADLVRLTSSSNPGVSAKVLATDSSGRLQLVKAGIGAVPIYPLHVQDAAGVQARIAYDTTYYADIFVDGGGNLKLAPTGMLVINAGGEAVVPNINYTGSIGLPNRKWLTLHVAELQADILVAREKVVTIGGRFMVAAGGVLISDCPATS